MEQETFFDSTFLEVLAEGSKVDLIDGLENLLAPELRLRRKGLEALCACDAPRRSPLVAAVLAAQIKEPDLDLRMHIIAALAEILVPVSEEKRASPKTVRWLRNVLASMRRREVFALLQVIARDADQMEPVCSLLQTCSFSGETMLAIVKNGHTDIAIRVAAVQAIAAIGYLDAVRAFEKLHQRISGQIAGQIPMAFASRLEAEAERLLPALEEALHLLMEVED